ncbi:hypothetical protein EK21DRAFT_104661 [Setomelanomma holmii]|uniref:DUF5597 domain-containing protein n=1 Tax=Setomelanomma holmii TaxID=210430 RepID=A0A9P4GYI9_9PLEO|nr:hypothetical protein EK21DRAFT_104661 [Setomelanomma holmii]
MSSAGYMSEIWPKMVATNVNTLLGCVPCEMIEPEEGQFDSSELDKVILGTREHGLHLILLWFGTWKNGRSTYLRKAGGVVEIADVLSLFHKQNNEADVKAFRTLLSHVKEIEEGHNTVLMVQVENEVGLLFNSRDASLAANKQFNKAVPSDLLRLLAEDYDNLNADEEVFGKGPKTDKLFMAYHCALYVNRVAAVGKEAYQLSLYTNVWQNYAGDDSDNDFPVVVGGGGMPGDYPSGGAISDVLDIWLQFAPSLDFIAPDVYLNDYSSSCTKDEYGVRRIRAAYGTFQALMASPFGIDMLEPADNPFTKHYGLLDSVSQIVLDVQRKPKSSVGFYFDDLPIGWKMGEADPTKPYNATFGSWTVTTSRCFVFGKPGGGARFLLLGWGFQISVQSTEPATKFNGILRFEEKVVEERATGDETRSGAQAMMPNVDPDYRGFPIAVTIPARTAIAEIEFYSF